MKPVKIWSDTDRWSLISLAGECKKDIELKFREHIERDYQFSVDSFQITLNPILSTMVDNAIESLLHVGPGFLPHVYASCLYRSFSVAFHHLNNRLICTRDPEKTRGSELLRYYYLRALSTTTVERLQLRMSIKFFTDFSLRKTS